MFTLEQAVQKMLPSEFHHVVPSFLVDKLTDAAGCICVKNHIVRRLTVKEKIQESSY